MTLYKVVCEGPLGQNLHNQPPEGYVLHVLAESPEAAARKARATGHTVRTVFARYRPSALARLRQLLAGVASAAACPRCGYSFDGQVINAGCIRCPECGTSLRLYARAEPTLDGSAWD